MSEGLLLLGEWPEADLSVVSEVELLVAREQEVVLGDAFTTGHGAHSLII